MTALPFRALESGAVAVVGASDNAPLTMALDANLRRFDPGIEVFPVNPRRARVWDRTSFGSIAEIPADVSLAIVMTPPSSVEAVLDDAIAAGVGAAIVYTAGYAEVGAAGGAAQQRLHDLASLNGLELWGPNCLGLISPAAQRAPLIVPTGSIPAGLESGSAALVSQSGGLMLSTMELASRLGVGLRHLVATGNEAGVTSIEALDRVVDDPEVRVLGLIAEGVRDGRRFMDVADRAARLGKAVLALKLGRSAVGVEAVASHTAVVAGSGRVFDAMCAEVGVHVMHTIAELVDGLATRSRASRAATGGLAVLTISGGTSVLVADLAERFGLPLATLTDTTTAKIASLIPGIATAANPLDVTTAMYERPDLFGQCADAVAGDPGVGAVAFVLHLRHSGEPRAHRDLVDAFWDAARRTDTPFAVVSSIPEGVAGHWRTVARAAPGPMLNGIDGMRALALLLPRPGYDQRSAIHGHARSGSDHARVVTEVECYASVLMDAGVPIAPHELVHDAIAAGRAAEAVSFPVVLKLQSPDLPHRAAVGAVRFGIGSVEQAELAYEELMQVITRMDREVEVQGVLVQRQVTAVGPEILVGTTLDAAFGPVTSVGVGGMHAETSTPSIRRAPVSPETASETVDTLFHGLPASLRATMEVQREALVAAIVALSAVGCQAIASGEMTEFEVNPLVLTAEGPVIVDALGIDRSARP